MREDGQTSRHLLLASIVSIFSTMLAFITIAMSWELWMVLLLVVLNFSVWCLHIGRIGSAALYENLCAIVLLLEFFFFGVHRASLFEIPVVACMVIIVLSILDRRMLLYVIIGLYMTELLYHVLYLHTIDSDIEMYGVIRIVLGTAVTAGSAAIARYKIARRREARRYYDRVFVELETAGRQNAVFLSNVSHELRTPINMVIGLSEVILEKDISSEIREDMHSIQLAGKRLSSQINNMLDYTEIVEGTLTPAKEEYMITSVLNDVMTMMAMHTGGHQLEMVFDINPRVPSFLIGDAEKISQVLKILLENSIKFTEKGGINVCIDFRRESYGVNLLIDINDTGIGMTDSQLTQVYEDFYQSDSGSRRFTGGLGLGIPIAQGILHAMGGFLHFESGTQGGLQVHIAIPQGVADETPSMELTNADEILIACYFRPEKYSCDGVRRYYDRLILHLMEGLDIKGYQTHSFEGLLKLQRSHAVTPVFSVQSDYEENSSYYEELAEKLPVIVIAEKDFTLSRESRMLIIRKPFFALSVVNVLNGEVGENGFEEAQAAGRRPFSCVGVKVLAVDDEEMNLVVAKGVLGSYGIEVETCLGGKEAVERCKSNSYDIIFLDHMMPGFDGVETLRRIREINNGIYEELPIVALTANTISGAREMFRSEGFAEFIPKPIERAVLERVLRRILPKRCIHYSEEPVSEDSLPNEAESAVENVSVERTKPETRHDQPKEPGYAAGEILQEDTGGRADGGALHYDSLVQAGINVKMGLDFCCGEEDFYLEMLQMFQAQRKEKKDELNSLYETCNWADYAVKVHALKSTSLTIGAEKLSEHAKALEYAGKKEDVEYIRTNHSMLLALYDEVCESIEKL